MSTFDINSKGKIKVKSNEHELTKSCVEWFRMQYPQYKDVLVHSPNEGKRNTKIIYTKTGMKVVCTGGKRLKEEGLVAGVADLLLLVPRHGYGSLGIEMKYGYNNQQDKQIEWQSSYEKAGNKYYVCKSLDSFMQIINEYLDENQTVTH